MSVVCKVCGSTFHRLTITHMRTHKLTLDQYYKAYPGNVSNTGAQLAVIPSQLMQGLSTWVNTGQMPQNVETLVNGLYSDPENKLRTILMAVALAKVSRLSVLQNVIDNVSGKLYDEKKLAGANINQLLQIMRVSQAEVMEILNLFKDITTQPKPAGDTFNFNLINSPNPVPDKADVRNKLFHFLSSVLKKASEEQNSLPAPIEVVPEKGEQE